jgi:hypothetical protein
MNTERKVVLSNSWENPWRETSVYGLKQIDTVAWDLVRSALLETKFRTICFRPVIVVRDILSNV